MISFDCNILICAADNRSGERHLRAVDLIERSIRSRNSVQTLQSLGEFFSVMTRKLGVAPNKAAAFVKAWRAVMPVEAGTDADLAEAMRAVAEHRLAFWDAMLWATVSRIGVRTLFTEDFQDGPVLGGLRFVNPFDAGNSVLIDQMFPTMTR